MTEKATLGAGCFWCIEAVFQSIAGVGEVVSGYTGGRIENPTYREICTGKTGHAEVAQITFNPSIISFSELLEIFWSSHDPTTLNRQGADVGTQYRSAIFYHNDEQKKVAEQSKKALDASHAFDDPVVTEITPLGTFYEAEDYHQNYFNSNSEQPYCQFVVKPKVDKIKRVFAGKLKQ
ncbi:MAG: peptide-methionine (S)-S-oxide reductase MsrA [Bacteroidota bacterium]